MDKNSEELVWAIKNGELQTVKDVVEKQNFDVNYEIASRFPLHYAADYGQTSVLDYLLSKGANVNAVDKHGITPILAAIWEGHTACVQLLLDKGATKSGTAPDGTSYVDAAEKDEIKKLLV
ncbi:Myotrophin [Pseudolycoriella hygida]|uniref:Myotrophin n=1 Tax=Pseudolycoriella hygida TaxID=35572 RepID=A0A9Q0S5Q0_9DIPT|nr:Myotrophin [Pseudolycoriella hygida]